MLTVGSMFAGIGGLELGLERAGMRTAWQVEIDDYATRVLEKHWFDVRRWRDIRTFPPEPVEDWRVDLICGGFPCQDISCAGRGAGLAGERSGLFFELVRVVRVVRPRYVLLENVAALLSRGLGAVLGELAALGYDAEWHCIPAAAVGAPHIRDRVFIIGVLPDALRSECEPGPRGRRVRQGDTKQCEVADSDRRLCHRTSHEICPGRYAINDGREMPNPESDRCGPWRAWRIAGVSAGQEDLPALADANHAGCQQQRGAESIRSPLATAECGGWWATEPDVGRVVDGVSHRVDRLRCLGNAVVPQVSEWIGRAIVEAERCETE